MFDKVVLRKIKLEIKRSLISISKFGYNDFEVFLYFYIEKDFSNVYPVVFVDSPINPFGESFYPTKVISLGIEFPNIDIYSETNDDYIITRTHVINCKEFKKDGLSFKEISYDEKENIFDLDLVKSYNDKRVCEFKRFKSFDKLLSSDKVVMEDKVLLDSIKEKIKTDTSYTLEKDKRYFKLFYSTSPIIGESLSLCKYMEIDNESIVSVVKLETIISPIKLISFYRYVDIWDLSLLGEK